MHRSTATMTADKKRYSKPLKAQVMLELVPCPMRTKQISSGRQVWCLNCFELLCLSVRPYMSPVQKQYNVFSAFRDYL